MFKLTKKDREDLADILRTASIAIECGANTPQGAAEVIADWLEFVQQMRTTTKK